MILHCKTFSARLALAALPLAVLIGLGLAGCGGADFKTAPVSGTVTLNGEPVADIQVLFQPIGTGQGNPGPGSKGLTDADGRYTLKTVDGGRNGAVPGPHQVMLMYLDPNASEEGQTTEGPEAEAAAAQKFKLPPKARDGSQSFTVPEEGTDAADFDFTSSGS
jgi:hypothetical protein